MNSFWDATSTCFQRVKPWLLRGNIGIQKHQCPGCDDRAKLPQAHSPRLGSGNWGWGSGVISALRPHTNSPAIPSPALRRVLTARVSYSTSFWTELMIGAAAEGMARANGGPHDRAPGRGPGCSSLRIAPRRLRRHLRPRAPGAARKNTSWALKLKIQTTRYSSGVSGSWRPTYRQGPPQARRGGAGGYTIER